MFHAGEVTPSSPRLLQLLIGPGDLAPLLEFDPPVNAGLRALSGGGLLPLALVLLKPLLRPDMPGDRLPLPVTDGLRAPAILGPMQVGNLDGFIVWATRLKDARHCRTCAGSFFSYRSTVRKRSWAWRPMGGCSQAFRKCETFSICMKGILEFLNFMPGGGMARLASLRKYVSA